MGTTELTKLRNLCQTLGGDLRGMSEEDFDIKFYGKGLKSPRGLYNAPFTHHDLGVDFPRKRVLYSTRCGEIEWAEVIHEMAHVFASTKNPEKCDEWSFLGWEYAVCLYIGGDVEVWKKYMADYGLGNGDDFGTVSPKQQQVILDERLAAAKVAGLVTRDGTPLSIRKSRKHG